MKKSFSVFTLVMLLAVQILTPVTYAVGDEEFVEESIVQEETPEDVEEVSDDVDDETEDVDLDEEEDEDSLSEEDDSFSGDAVDENLLEMSRDVIPDAESESGDVVVMDSESGAVAATGSEVVVESGVDVSGTSSTAGFSESSVTVDDEFITKLSKQGSVAKIAEKLGINWYTDSSEWAIKAGIEGKYLGTKEQNNIIREYFIQHAREILGAQESNEVVNEEVVEEPEVVELNKEEISGKKYYNGVTAIVLAPINTFPEGTTLSIVPIKAKKDLNEIKEQLVEQQDEVTEESNVVAFDISFLYSGEEVQPVSGQTVQVTFNYGNHEKLSEANEDEEQELKVYHLNDKDGSGNKVEDIKDVKVEVVDIVKNKEGELVVDAESFSIYTIVTQVAEEGPEALENQLANFEYGMISIARPDSIAAEGNPEGFTIMDRNLGALEAGTGNNSKAYGYHYQWGNNYGFNSIGDLSAGNKTGIKIDVSGSSTYSGNQFVWGESNSTWMSGSNNNDLWNGDNRQGPCPDGWHVPTIEEWNQLLIYYAGYYTGNNMGDISLEGNPYKYVSGNSVFESGFYNYFQIPFAGDRFYTDAEVKRQGVGANLWSSTPYDESARNLYLSSSRMGANYYGSRANGYSVRCFKDDYVDVNSNVHTITFDFNGGSGSTAAINVISGEKVIEPEVPIKEGYAFGGWYKENTYENKFNFNEEIVTEDIELYAQWNTAAYLVSGWNFNLTIKRLTGQPVSDPSTENGLIKRIQRSGILTSQYNKELISIENSMPVWAWFDSSDQTIYYYSEAEKIFLHKNSSSMFRSLETIENIDLDSLDTSMVENMYAMFQGDAYQLQTLDLSNFDTSNVNNMGCMFYGCYRLKRLDLSSFDTSKVTTMEAMFSNCNDIEYLNVSSFDTSSVNNMSQMFQYLVRIEKLDLRNFETIGVTNMDYLFNGSDKLKIIYVGDGFKVNEASSRHMSNGLNSIIGGNGTTYDSTKTDKTYAVIDSGDVKGYFTDPNNFTVRFFDLDGNEVGTQHIAVGEKAEKMFGEDIEYYTGSDKQHEFNFDEGLDGYTAIYVDGYKVIFHPNNGGEDIVKYVSKDGEHTVSEISIEKEGYDFAGWLTDSSCYSDVNSSCFYDFDNSVNHNFDLYAYWEDPKSELEGWDGCYKYKTKGQNVNGSYVAEITDYNRSCNKENLYLPEKITRNGRDYLITSIGDHAFTSGGLSGTLVFSPYIENLEWSAFIGNSDLKHVVFNDNLKVIGKDSFYFCGLDGDLEIPSTVEIIGENAFAHNPNLSSLVFEGNSLTTLGNGAFNDTSITNVLLPNSLTTLGNGAFCSDSSCEPGSIVGVVSGATSMQIASLESQDNTECLVLKKDKYELTYNAGAHGGKVDGLLTTGVVVDYNGTVQLTGNGAKTAISDKGYTFLGWTDEEGKETTINSIVVTGDTEVYPVFKQTITATFNGNGNTVDNQKQQVVRECDRYNNQTKCTIVDVPVIDNNPYTDTILGYSKSAATGSVIAQFGTVTLNAATIALGTADIEIDKNEVLYAQTYKPAVTHTVTYKKGEGNDAKGVISFDPYNRSCTIAAIYNGNNNVEQATGCELVAPEILVANNYAGYWDGPLYSGDVYTVYNDKTLNAYSTGEHYSISFYLGEGGTWPTGVTQQDSYQQGDTVVINAPIWTGYTFIGWTTGSNTEPVMNVSIQPTDKGAKLFVAHWQQDEYRIIYSDTVQGTTNLVKTYSYNNGSTLVAPNKSPIGYTFKGWIGENGDTPETSVTIAAGMVGDKYFTAVWEPETYTVTGHLNGGNILGETSYIFTYDIESGNINLSMPTRDNSTFIGWTGSNGSSPDLNVVIPQGSHGDKEYYAVYDCNEGYEANGNTCVLKPYSITYVLDGGKQTTVNPQETVTRDETSYKINIKNPIKTGYNFQGWTTNIGNLTCKEGVIVRDNCRAESENDLTIEFTEGQAVTLTAKWTHVPIEVTQQDLIGITPTGIAVVTQYDYENGRVDLAAEIMTGYKTKGWSLDTNGVVVYNDQTKEYVKGLNITYDNPTAVTGGTGRVSLYSVRELINYNIKYLTDEGVHINPLTYNVTQQDIVLSDAEKTGYVFNGWYDTDENKIETITPETIAEITSPYKLTLTAKWQASKNTKYHVYHERAWIDGNYYKLSGDLTDIDELTGETNTSVIAQRKTNYEGFIMPVDQQTAKIEADGSTEIIYQYEREKNTYKYNTVVGATTAWKRLIDENYSTDSSTQQMYYQTPIILSGRANTGYSWSGWDVTIGTETTRIEGTNENHEHTIIMPLTNVEVTPVVYHIPYTLTYNVNGGTGNEAELQEVSPIYYDSGITYPVVTRMGYTFLGWFDDNGTEDESDDVYYGLGDNANNKKMPNGNLNLVAHWSANPFVLKVNHYQMDLTGNYPAQPTKEVPIDTYIDVDITSGNNANILPETYTGFTLSGDAVESIHINPDGTTKIDYYYIRDKHNVTVNTNEGVTLSGTLSGSYYYQTPVSVEAIINEGYTWSGWNVTTGENEPVFTTDTGVAFILGTGNVILTPLTTTNSYHLTIKNDGTLVFSGDVLYKTNISQYLTTPSKAGYTFNGWSNRPANDLMPAKDLVIEAKWTYKSNGGGGGGGGGSSSSDDKKVIINNTGDKQQEHSSAELTGTSLTGTNKDLKENEVKEEQPEKAITDMNFDELKNLSADKLKKVDRTKLTKEENEILDAYEWAYEHNVTTMVTLNDANPEGVVTRGHLAKMVVNYAINVLGQQLPEKVPSECRWNDWRGDWESDEIKDYAVKACSLGLMGLDMKKFSPKLRVTRAQFGTIMSRLLWGKKYAGGTPYYRKHLNALKENNIMTQIGNPEGRVELRQWVWLMLMRAAMDKNV